MRSPSLLTLVLFTVFFTAQGQGEIPVDMYTGTPSITLPIGTISSLDVAQPVVLSYSTSAQQQSWFGQGWNLQAGGSISREVRGLPDDFGTGDTQAPARKGWLSSYNSNTVAYDILIFNPASDTAASTYGTSTPSLADEPKDYDKLANGYKDEIDTEPDIFNYSFGGMSGKFVFNNSASFTGDLSLAISTIPYRDIKIEPTINATSKKIESFKITTNDGYTYTFASTAVCTASKKIVRDGGWADVHILTTDYKLYATEVTYNVEWMLTEMKSPAGNTLTYTYTSGTLQSTPDEPVNVAMFREDDAFVPGSLDYITKPIYKIQTTRTRKIPLTITGSTGSKFDFNYNTTDKVLESITVNDTRKSPTYVKTYLFSYITVWHTRDSEAYTSYLYDRKYLRTFSEESGCSKTLPYTLSYNVKNTNENLTGVWSLSVAYVTKLDWLYNVVNGNETNIPQLFVYPSEPMRNRFRDQDINGYGGTYYYLSGIDKGAYASKGGTLFSIQYPAGGMTTFFFEPNRYYDDKGANARYAEGLRIRKIDYWDGSGNTPISKTFEYLDASGKSSGRIFRRAIYSIPAYKWKDLYIPSSTASSAYKSYSSIVAANPADRWKYLTIRTEWNIAPNDADNVVGYARVKVSRTGSGYAVHEFEVPATYGQTTSGEWETPKTVFARKPKASPNQNSPMTNMDDTIFPSGGTWRFPNAPNPFYDYARGLPSKVTEYTEAGRKVRVVSTMYQDLYKTGSSAYKVYGLKYDRFAFSEDNTSSDRIYMLSKYFLLTNADRVPLRDTVKLYDANDATGTKFVSEITEYTYGSANHKLLTEIKKTSAEGNIYKTRFKYPKDYANQSTGEAAVQMLNTLATTFRHGAPIETVTTLKKGAGAELVTGATAIKYAAFDQSKPMAESQWALELDAPVSDFVDSYILSSSGYKFKIDDRYLQVSAVLGYKSTGLPTKIMSTVSRDSAETGYAYTNTLPVIKSVKATASQTAYSDFNNTTDFSFSYNGTPYFAAGRSGSAFHPGVALYKNNISRVMSANNYVLSFWLKSTATLYFNVSVKQATGTSTYLTLTPTSVNSTGGEFKYVEILVPMTSISSSVKLFRIEFMASGLPTIPAGGFTAPVIDDVFFFPEGTHMESYSYQIPYGVASVTTGNGGSSSIEYDGLGRERLVRDRDGNIVKRNTHIIVGSPSLLFAEFTAPDPVSSEVSSTFRALEPTCAGTVTYEWDWGDGSGYVTGAKFQAHTFDSPGLKTIKLRTSAAGYTSAEKVMTIQVLPIPITANLCAEGVEVFNGTTATITSSFPDCGAISPAPTTWKTAFKLYNVTGCEGGCTYRWIRRDIGSTTWLEVGSGGTQYTSEKIVTNTNSFQVMCEIKRGTEASFTAGPITVTITH